MPTRNGSFRLFKLFGIEVFLHWSWFLLALYVIQSRKNDYSSITWNILAYLTLFLIVLTHEFGHALACRSVGGQANQIVLWPFGGVAYVSPPQRPGAVLWSIFAGPLVNIILLPVLSAIWWFADSAGLGDTAPDVLNYLENIWGINLVLLVFNMLPIYPLDGGQIFRALLWFVLGPVRSLMVATVVGFIGITGLAALAILECYHQPQNGIWLLAICAFIFLNCYQGFKHAREMLRMAKAPRYEGYHCPLCKTAPPMGEFWGCGKCRKKFDAIPTHLVCPYCSTRYERIACFECGTANPLIDWMSVASPHQPSPQ
jgi:Zn-dependent protease